MSPPRVPPSRTIIRHKVILEQDERSFETKLDAASVERWRVSEVQMVVSPPSGRTYFFALMVKGEDVPTN